MSQQINWKAVVEIVRANKCQTRLKVVGWEESEWSATVLIPTAKCIELPSLGPIAVDQVEYLDILVRFQKSASEYGRPQILDVAESVAKKLNENGVLFRNIANGDVLRIEACQFPGNTAKQLAV